MVGAKAKPPSSQVSRRPFHRTLPVQVHRDVGTRLKGSLDGAKAEKFHCDCGILESLDKELESRLVYQISTGQV